MKDEIKQLWGVVACLAVVFAAEGRTFCAKSPNGENEIRLMTEPVLSYAVCRSGTERVAATPLSLEIAEIGTLGGAGAKVVDVESVRLEGSVPAPVYKKASVDMLANRTTVKFEGGWSVALVARESMSTYGMKNTR